MRYALPLTLFVLLSACGDDGTSVQTCGRTDCCAVCENSQPCGDSCIPEENECTAPQGCACSQAQTAPCASSTPSTPCCRVCTSGKACGDGCIPVSSTCRTSGGCACNG